MELLIFGANGFVGSNLCDVTNAQMYDNFFLDKPRSESIVYCDITDKQSICNIFKECKPGFVVLNLAAIHHIPYCNQFPADAIFTNAYGNQNLYEAALMYGASHYVLASSGAVYKPSEDKHTEMCCIESSDIYSASKILSESTIKNQINARSFKRTILRFFNIVGKGDYTPHLLPDLYEQVTSNENFINVGNLNTVRDYIHINDVCDLINLVLNSEVDYAVESFNVCTAIPTSGHEILSVMQAQLMTNKIVKVDPTKLRKSDRPSQVGDNSKAYNFFSWRPKHTIKDAITDYLDWVATK